MTMLQELVLDRLLASDDGLRLDALIEQTGFAETAVSGAVAELTDRGFVVVNDGVWRAVRFRDGANVVPS
jgi:DNA-binding transcriptional regulator GbsR (MarR family)